MNLNRLLSLILAVGLVAVPLATASPAMADIQNVSDGITTIENKIQPLPPLTPINCTAMSWLFGANCININSWIITYNQYVQVYNQTQQQLRKNLEYARYGTSVATDYTQNVHSLEDLINRTQDLSWTNVNQDEVMQKTEAAINKGIPPAQMDAHLNQQMVSRISTTLQALHLLNQQDLTHEDVADKIALAAAHATSPIQAEQMTVQILRVISEQLSTLIHVDMMKIQAGEQNSWIATQRALSAQAAQQAQAQQLSNQLLSQPAPTPRP